MRYTPHYMLTDVAEVKRVIRENPWATFVSNTAKGLVASHYPIILDEAASDGDDIVIVSHFGRPDERSHELGQHEVLVIVQGPHDYVSPTLYDEGDIVPTWDHITAHLWGTPELLSDEENYQMLVKLVDYFEADRPGGHSILEDEAATRQDATGTVGLRMVVSRFDARAKLSQDKAETVRARITDHFDTHNPRLGRELRHQSQRESEREQRPE